MKRSVVICLAVTVIALISCQRDEKDFVNLNQNLDKIVFSTSGEQANLIFEASDDWSVVSSATWLEISPREGLSGKGVVSLRAPRYEGHEDRSGEVVVTSGDATQTITVVQRQRDMLVVSGDIREIGPEGGQIKLLAASNIPFEIKLSDEWMSIRETRAYSEKEYILTVQPRKEEDYDNRSGEVVFTAPTGQSQTIKVCQAKRDAIILDEREKNFTSEGGELLIPVRTNIDLSVRVRGQKRWLKHLSTRSLHTSYFKFRVSPNNDHSGRSAEIEIRDRNSDKKEIYKVFQAQKDAVIISNPDIDLDYKEQKATIEVDHNIPISVYTEGGGDWIHPLTTRTLEKSRLSYRIDANPGKERREAYICVKNEATGIEQRARIHQDCEIANMQSVVIELEGDFKHWSIDTIKFAFDIRIDTARVIGNKKWEERMRKGHFVDENDKFYPVVKLEHVAQGDFHDCAVMRYDQWTNKDGLGRTEVRSSIPVSRMMASVYIQQNHDAFEGAADNILRHDTAYSNRKLCTEAFDIKLRVTSYMDGRKMGEYEETMHFKSKRSDGYGMAGQLVSAVRDVKELGKDPTMWSNGLPYTGRHWTFAFNNMPHGLWDDNSCAAYGFYYDIYNPDTEEPTYNNPWSNWPEFPPYDPDMR